MINFQGYQIQALPNTWPISLVLTDKFGIESTTDCIIISAPNAQINLLSSLKESEQQQWVRDHLNQALTHPSNKYQIQVIEKDNKPVIFLGQYGLQGGVNTAELTSAAQVVGGIVLIGKGRIFSGSALLGSGIRTFMTTDEQQGLADYVKSMVVGAASSVAAVGANLAMGGAGLIASAAAGASGAAVEELGDAALNLRTPYNVMTKTFKGALMGGASNAASNKVNQFLSEQLAQQVDGLSKAFQRLFVRSGSAAAASAAAAVVNNVVNGEPVLQNVSQQAAMGAVIGGAIEVATPPALENPPAPAATPPASQPAPKAEPIIDNHAAEIIELYDKGARLYKHKPGKGENYDIGRMKPEKAIRWIEAGGIVEVKGHGEKKWFSKTIIQPPQPPVVTAPAPATAVTPAPAPAVPQKWVPLLTDIPQPGYPKVTNEIAPVVREPHRPHQSVTPPPILPQPQRSASPEQAPNLSFTPLADSHKPWLSKIQRQYDTRKDKQRLGRFIGGSITVTEKQKRKIEANRRKKGKRV